MCAASVTSEVARSFAMYCAAMSPGMFGFISAGIAPSQTRPIQLRKQSALLVT